VGKGICKDKEKSTCSEQINCVSTIPISKEVMEQSNVKTITVMTTHPARSNRPRCIQKEPVKVTTEQGKVTGKFILEENATPIPNTPSRITVKMVDQQVNAQDLEAFLKKVKSNVYKFPGREDLIEHITRSLFEDPEEEDETTIPTVTAKPQSQRAKKGIIIAVVSMMAIATISIGAVFIARRVVQRMRANGRLPYQLVTYIPGIRLRAPAA